MSDIESQTRNQRARIASAAVRAAYAWSVRDQQRVQAIEEIARMTGVIMMERGPRTSPATPMELIRSLRQPLRNLLPSSPDDEPDDGLLVDDLTLLTAGDQLADATWEVATDYTRDVVLGLDPGRQWLPSWSWMQSNEAENATFGKLKDSIDANSYRLARRTLIENPAGSEMELATAYNTAAAPRVADYVKLPAGKQHLENGSAWWWACPECRWPMDVAGVIVRCRYHYHPAVFQIAERPRRAPQLIRTNPRPGKVDRALPTARPAESAQQVDDPIWRFIVVPGTSELRIARVLDKLGAEVELFPGFDRYDLDIRIGDRRWQIDIKEHASAEGLLRHLEEKPPSTRYVVIPDSHAGQATVLRGAQDRYEILTEADLVSEVSKAVRREKRRDR